MARIPLRSYNREIENLIDRGQIEEAIAHSKNILKQYPKHIETYRLLGKAFLESQRYSEASDILQRVLSVIPDDFVSQLGLSIIREDEGNLDAAIWHMERAYEVQPFNRAVQDELRRLYGRRDGLEPPRVRLNRGSLVRMYSKGELYPQAIAETRAALAEDPQRLDLQVLLARNYFLTGQKVEAAEISSALLAKMPYCLEANRILMDILPATSRAEEARSFQRRVYDLDPYMEFISPNAPISDQVPEQAVMVEHIEWQASEQESQGPDWARTIGVSWEEKPEEELPDWLNSIPSVPSDLTAPPAAGEDLIPDFMRSAGWSQSAQAEEAVPDNQDGAGLEAETGLEMAEMPDWLQSMANAPAQGETDAAASLDWLTQPASPAEGNANEPTKDAAAFEWLTETPAPTLEPSQPLEEENIPAWLSAAPVLDSDETVPEAGEIPAWLVENQIQPVEPAVEEEQFPVAVAPADSAAGSAAGSNELPDWLRMEGETSGEYPDAVENLIRPPAAEPERPLDTSEWLKAGELEQIKTGELPSWLLEESSPQKSGEEPLPEWLRAETNPAHDSPTPAGEPEILPLQQSEKAADADETLDAGSPQPIPEILSQSAPAETTEPSVPDLSDMDAAMAWLEGLAAKQGADDESLKIVPPELRSETPPEWLSGFIEPVEPQTQPEIQSKIQPEAASEDEAQGQLPVAQNPIWQAVEDTIPPVPAIDLDSIFQADEAPTVEVTGEERPDWLGLQNIADENAAPAAIEAEPSAAAETVEDLPEWLRDLTTGPAPSLEQTPEEEPAQEEIPAWLTDLTETSSLQTPAGEPIAATDQLIASEPLAAMEPTVEETLPQVQTDERLTASTPDLNDMDSALAWLEGLAAKQGADEETLTISRPEDRAEKAPDWIAALAAEEVPAQETAARVDETQPVKRQPQPEPISLAPAEQAAPENTAEAAPTSQSDVEIPAWLAGLEEEATEKSAIAEEIPSAGQLSQTAQNAPLEWIPEPEATGATQPQTAAAPDLNNMDAAMAWLESLAAKQGADEATLKITNPEDRSANTPAWISELASEETAPIQMPETEPPHMELSSPETDPSSAQFIQPIPAQEVTPASPANEAAPESVETEIPGWLLNYEEEQQNKAQVLQPVNADENVALWLQRHHPGTQSPESSPAETGDAPLSGIQVARAALQKGEIDAAVDLYTRLIETDTDVESATLDLLAAATQHPAEFGIWQALGDALLRGDKIQEALDAYTKAEELIK